MHESEEYDGAIGKWRENFMRAPYLRDHLVKLGLIVETFETACTWDKFSLFCFVVFRSFFQNEF
jgi:alkyldihydroxyacetonephosphate synthase